ncbi:hypothetical protein TNCV_544911 [Trichonephila clavipes]|nr:hypothetical protein TNCV_544911 [Trichonephila clavipes]
MVQITWSVAKSPRVAEQCDVNIQSINQPMIGDKDLEMRSGAPAPSIQHLWGGNWVSKLHCSDWYSGLG